ncbi:MAG: hypothetical protein IT371_30640 [Deltaproteobacteria bacterium]|nr:hypothetical protein [Deltaproteobacteria bacterium]
MRSSSTVTTRLVLALVVAAVLSACCPPEIKDKAAIENAVHQGYLRLIDEGAVDTAGLTSMVRASATAWAALDEIANGADEGQPQGQSP